MRAVEEGGRKKEDGGRLAGAEGSGARQVTIGDVTELRVEQVRPSGSGFFTYVDIGSIDRDSKTIVAPKTMPKSEAPSRARQLLRAGDVLVSMTRPNLNAVALVPSELDGAIASTGFNVLRPKRIEGKALYYTVQTTQFVEAMCSKVQGALYPAVRPSDIASYIFHLPSSLSVQRSIVATIDAQLSRLEAGVAALQRAQANLKRYRASVLKAACEGRLVPTEADLARREGRDYETGAQLLQRILAERRKAWTGKGKYKEPEPPDTTGLPELPEGWCWASVGQLSTKVVDGVHKKPTYVPSGIPFVTVRNLTAGAGISLERLHYVTEADHAEFSKRTNVERGDILISKDGTLGVVRIVDTDVAFSVFVSVALVKPVCRAMGMFLLHALSAPQVQLQMVPKGSGLQHIHLEDLRADCIPVAPMEEQHRIVAEVERRLSIADRLMANLGDDLGRAGRMRQAVLLGAFGGRASLASASTG